MQQDGTPSGDGEEAVERIRRSAGKSVAVIEDLEDLAVTVIMLLEAEGYVADYALTGAAGLELVRSMHADAVLIDYVLPDMTGGAVGNALRAMSLSAELKILMCTSTSEATVRSEFRAYDAFLPKPVDHQHLMRALAAALKAD